MSNNRTHIWIEYTYEESNESLKLVNVTLGLWRPLIDILNDNSPRYIQGDDNDVAFLNDLLNSSEINEELIEKVRLRFEK